MGNYFDSLKPKFDDTLNLAPVAMRTVMQPVTQQMGAQALQPISFDAPQSVAPVAGMGITAPVSQPAPQQVVEAAPVVTANPFDQFDTQPTATAQQAIPQQAIPQQVVAQPAPERVGNTDAIGNHVSDASRTDAERWEAARSDIAAILNSNLSTSEVKARLTERLARDGATLANLGDIDAILKSREQHPNSAIPVGIKAPDQVAPVEHHAPDRGKVDSFAAGALDTLGLGAADEVGGALGAAANSIGNAVGLGTGEKFGDAYTRMRDENRQILADDQHYNPGTFLTGQVAGGLASAAVGGGEISAARAALEGAGYGGFYGFNSANGGIEDRLEEGAKGAALGGTLGGAIGGVGSRIARGIEAHRATPSAGREILNAADRLNAGVAPAEQIRPLPAHVSQGGAAALGTAMLEPTLTGGLIGGLQGAGQRFDAQGGAALNRIADRAAGGSADDLTTVAARANDNTQAGTLASYREDSRQAATTAYNQAEQLAGDVRLSTPRTIDQIDRKLAEWRATPGGVAGSHALSDLRENLANGTFTVAGLRRLRTSFGDALDSNNRTVAEAAKSLWPTLSSDITQGLRNAGKSEAATAYQSADRSYAQRIANLDVINKVIGKDADMSADGVASRLTSMASSDYNKLSQAMSAIHPDQANAIRGGLITQMGEAGAGRAVEPNQFSFESFATRWGKLSDQAKSALYSPATVRDLNDLATMASAKRQVGRLGNPSRSGVFLENWKQSAKVLEAFGVGTAGVASPHALAAVGGAAALGRILASAGVARAMVAAGENRPVAFVARRLSEAARRNPALAQNILGMRDHLTNSGVTVNETGSKADATNPFDQFD